MKIERGRGSWTQLLLLVAGLAASATAAGSECDDYHAMVDLAFANFEPVLGRPKYEDRGVVVRHLTRPVKPFSAGNCSLLDYAAENGEPASRVLRCDMSAEAGMPSLAEKQTEAMRTLMLRTAESVSTDLSACFLAHPRVRETRNENRDGPTFVWSLRLWSRPAHGVGVALSLRQTEVGQVAGKPSFILNMWRFELEQAEGRR